MPCCTDDNCADEVTSEQVANNSQDNQDDCDNCCSPFLTCGACVGFTFSTQVFSFEPTTKFIENNSLTPSFKVFFVDYFFSTIWQPPKIS